MKQLDQKLPPPILSARPLTEEEAQVFIDGVAAFAAATKTPIWTHAAKVGSPPPTWRDVTEGLRADASRMLAADDDEDDEDEDDNDFGDLDDVDDLVFDDDDDDVDEDDEDDLFRGDDD
ncbi:MAG: hypothetical protein U0974_02140 [Gemmatimonadales bacterium]|nr:hypothetical protein [Gemmatimonadales bacterium]